MHDDVFLPHDISPSAVIEGVALYYQAPTVPMAQRVVMVMVHDSFHGAWSAGYYAHFFAAQGIGVLSFDWRNHGASAPLNPDQARIRTIEATAQDELSLALSYARQTLQADYCVVVGHGMGGLIAQKFVETQSVFALILLGSAPPHEAGGNALAASKVALDRLHMPGALTRRFALFRGFPKAARKQYRSYMTPESPTLIREGRGGTVPVSVHAVREHVRNILVVSSIHDWLAPRHIVRNIAAYYDADYVSTNSSGHCAMLYGPDWERIAYMINEWIKKRPELTAD